MTFGNLEARVQQAAVMAEANEFFSLSTLIHSCGTQAVKDAFLRGLIRCETIPVAYWRNKGWTDFDQPYRLVTNRDKMKRIHLGGVLHNWVLCACNRSMVPKRGDGEDDWGPFTTPDGITHVLDGVCA